MNNLRGIRGSESRTGAGVLAARDEAGAGGEVRQFVGGCGLGDLGVVEQLGSVGAAMYEAMGRLVTEPADEQQ